MQLNRLSKYLLQFLGWSAAFAVVYHFTADFYAGVLLSGADRLTDVVLPVTLRLHPNGFVAVSPEATGPMGMPYRLYLIGLNVVFAPALVLTTLGLNRQGVVRALLAVAIVMVLHTLQVVSIVLFSASHPDNVLFNLGYADLTVAVIAWIYKFMDRMGYALIPFMAWAVVCSDRLPQALQNDSAAAGTGAGSAIRRND
jgi:hypothetical protein